MLSIRLRRTGSKKRPFFRVVVSEARSKKEGEFIEVLGFYNPRTKPAVVEINKERITHWIAKGARPSDSVRTLLSKHLTRDRAVAQRRQQARSAADGTDGAHRAATGDIRTYRGGSQGTHRDGREGARRSAGRGQRARIGAPRRHRVRAAGRVD